MLWLHDDVRDNGANILATADRVYLCSAQPSTYAQATSDYALGYGTVTLSGPQSHAAGRKILSGQITGTADVEGTPAYWAAVDLGLSKLLAVGELTGGTLMEPGQSWTLDALSLIMPVGVPAGAVSLTATAIVAGAVVFGQAVLNPPADPVYTVPGPPIVNGWTDLSPVLEEGNSESDQAGTSYNGTGSRIIYVAPSPEGDDANLGTLASPKATLEGTSGGIKSLRDGYPDHLLLKKDGVWNDVPIMNIGDTGGNGYGRSGRSATEPMVIGAYGTGARPLLKHSNDLTDPNNKGIFTWGGGSKGDYMAFCGIEFYAYKRDPSNPSFTGWTTAGSTMFIALSVNMDPNFQWILVEDCKFSFWNIAMDTTDGYGGTPQNLIFRRNIIYDSWQAFNTLVRAHGVHLTPVGPNLIEENIFVRCGYQYDADGNVTWANPTPGVGNAVRENHLTYFASGRPTWPSTIRGNIFAYDPSGSQFRHGGRITNNLFVQSPYAMNYDTQVADVIGLIDNNVCLEEVGHTPNSGVYSSIELHAGLSGAQTTITNNIFANQDPNVNGINSPAITIDAGTLGAVVDNNICYKWTGWLTDNGTNTDVGTNKVDLNGDDSEGYNFPDPTRSVGSYAGTIGLTATLDAFLVACAAQSKDTWDSNLTAAAVNDYIRAGFE